MTPALKLEDSAKTSPEVRLPAGPEICSGTKHMEAEWKRCLRTEAPLSLVMFDIDHFKLYKDTYGHQAGDACLKKVGQNLTGGSVARRPGDLLARYGGEEFAVILSNCSEEHAADWRTTQGGNRRTQNFT